MLAFRTKQEALTWIKKETGYTPVNVETYSLTEYYRSNARFFSIRYNRKKRNFSCREKLLKNGGRYLSFYNGKTRTAVKVTQSNENNLTIDNRWLFVYAEYFDAIVAKLVSLGVNSNEAKDYAQEAFLKTNSYNAKNAAHYKNIWMRRSFYDFLDKSSRLNSLNKIYAIPELRYDQKEFEFRFAKMIKNGNQAEIINLIEHGYSITDISESTNKTYASISSIRNRAVNQLKSQLKSEL